MNPITKSQFVNTRVLLPILLISTYSFEMILIANPYFDYYIFIGILSSIGFYLLLVFAFWALQNILTSYFSQRLGINRVLFAGLDLLILSIPFLFLTRSINLNLYIQTGLWSLITLVAFFLIFKNRKFLLRNF